tara:strand:+ start:107 stop:208 length:102 start_codon:yes stop_codon:yes gene_type:complete
MLPLTVNVEVDEESSLLEQARSVSENKKATFIK